MKILPRALPFLAAISLLTLAIETSHAAAITVGGGLGDWGVSVADSNGSTYGVPNNSSGFKTLGNGFTFAYQTEDQSDSAGDSFLLGPNMGGQNYDSEFLGVGVDSGRLVIAIVTGQRPDNGFSKFAPGDIRIVTDQGDFGIEVGGGAGNNLASQAAITENAPGATYKLDSHGYTIGVRPSTGPTTGNVTGTLIGANQVAGSVWHHPTWIPDPIPSPTTLTQFQFTNGELTGVANYYYSRDSVTGQHAIIEVAIDFALLKYAGVLSVEWAPSCGNDLLAIDLLSSDNILQAPEPSSLALLGLGGLGLLAARRRKSRG